MSYCDVGKLNESLKEIKIIAEEELSCRLSQLAVAWVIKFKYTSSALIGVKNA